MRQISIEKNLRRALLQEGPFTRSLFEFELEEHIAEFLESKHEDADAYFFAITERNGEAAMLLIDQNDHILVNEDARTALKALWQRAYKGNIRRLISDMAYELDHDRLYVVGVKVTNAA